MGSDAHGAGSAMGGAGVDGGRHGGVACRARVCCGVVRLSEPHDTGTVGRYPLRRWTPIRQVRQPATIDDDGSKREGLAIGAPFRARMVQAYGVDDGEARRIVEMVTAEGCYRAFRADSFVAADQAIIAAEVARHPSTPDPASYATVLEPGQVEPGDIEAGKIAKYEIQHFVFWYGTNTKGDSYAYARDTGQDWRTVLTRAGAWAEQVWHLSRDLTGAPMPYADRPAGERRRIAVYISGTGRPMSRTAT